MKQVRLTNRLMGIASCISRGDRVADIGTDHGYLPVWLVQNGISEMIIASDVKEGPLNRARETAAEYGVTEKIRFLLTDGLTGIGEDDADTLVIAGVGGDTVIHILSRAPWTRGDGIKLILQPMTKGERLVKWLHDSGYAVKNERLARDGGEIYRILSAGGGRGAAPSQGELFAGRTLFLNRDPLLKPYLEGVIAKITRALQGMAGSEMKSDPERMRAWKIALEELINLRAALD